ncbi:MAG: hypothetical protein GTO02_20230 [Candidatus Dadabacteria bacterium]|nr:hypothetical protein [Candidatus Dadabacteria bacterium]NIQ16625.1 hypothetical protein [Candidatus Dadabacteria bacterium]
MKKILTSSILLLIALTFFSNANAGKKHWIKWWENEEIVKQLNVNDSQLSSIKKIDKDFKDKIHTLHEELKIVTTEYRNLIKDSKATNEQIKTKFEEKLNKKYALKKLSLEKKLKIRDILNDEQIVSLAELKSNKWHKHHKKCGKERKECHKDMKRGCGYNK